MTRDDGLTAKEIVLRDLDREWELMTEREAAERAREINDLADLALELDPIGREC